MNPSDREISALRDALRQSPDNLPLRRHLADTLMKHGRSEEAEAEYRQILSRTPHDTELKVVLAEVFHQQQKVSQAMVLIEELLKERQPPPAAYLLHCRLLFAEGEIERAVRAYKNAVSDDPSLADPLLAGQLGVDAEEESEVIEGRIRETDLPGEDTHDPEFERPDIAFADVGGMDDVKDEIRMKIVHPLTHPEIYEAYGKKIGGGILMYGPPGCGKTHLARATAGEVKANFLSVGIHDVLDMWIGQSERNLHEIFEHARRNAPCVLFFDEVDALGASRSDLQKSAARQLINQFLAELDGVRSSNDGVLIMGATNAPWHLDSAFRRAGRFDRIIFVPPPDGPARASIFDIHLKGKPTDRLDLHALAKKTKDFSGADIKGLIDVAIEGKLKEAMRSGVPSPLVTKDLLAVVKKHRPTTREWFATARNYALYSNQGGIYDDLLPYLKL